MTEQTDIMNAQRDHNKTRRAIRREDGQADIEKILSAYNVRNVNKGFQYRINSVLDLYPTNYRFHNPKTNKRGFYPSRPEEKFLEFIGQQLAAANEAPAKPQVSSEGGKCQYCGSATGARWKRICKDCSQKPMSELLFKKV